MTNPAGEQIGRLERPPILDGASAVTTPLLSPPDVPGDLNERGHSGSRASPAIGTNEHLLWRESFPRGPGTLDAIHIVTRGDQPLNLAQLRPLRVPVTIWSNPDTLGNTAWDSVRAASDMDITVTRIPRQYQHTLWAPRPVEEAILRPHADLYPVSNVRNVVMVHAAAQRHMAALLDDDIEWSADDMRAAVPPRDQDVVAAGALCQGVPDLSQLNHIRRLVRHRWRERVGVNSRMRYIGAEPRPAGAPLSSSGNALIVDAYRARLYYPPIYNEDRIATAELALGNKILLVGNVTQIREPAISDNRARTEVIGEVALDAATGWRRLGKSGVPVAEYCARVIVGMARINMGTRLSIDRYLARIAPDTDKFLIHSRRQLALAAARLAEFSGDDIHTLMSTYTAVRERYRAGVSRIPLLTELESFQYLGVEVLHRSSSALRRLGLSTS